MLFAMITPTEITGLVGVAVVAGGALGNFFGGYAQRQKSKESDNEQEAKVYNSIYDRQNKILDAQAEELKRQIDRANKAESAYAAAVLDNAKQQGQLERLSHLEEVVARLEAEIRELRAERKTAEDRIEELECELIATRLDRDKYRDLYEQKQQPDNLPGQRKISETVFDDAKKELS